MAGLDLHRGPARWGRDLASVVFGWVLLAASMGVSAQAAAGDDEAGKKLFTAVAQPPCGLCHVLAAAGAVGKIGPSLDELKPDAERVVRALKQGVGVMPSFEASLTDEQMKVLARYVARASGGSTK